MPRAHGAHPGYGIEWWYWVGHLRSLDGKREFGFQSTVFRLEGAAGVARVGLMPAFGDQQLFMAHAALSDLNNREYVHTERIFREGWQAKASDQKLDLVVGGIRAWMREEDETIKMTMELPEGHRLKLTMTPEKPLVAFGERGLSRKGVDPAAVSWYWTYPRLALKGQVVIDDEIIEVEGMGWMDHEISSSQLGSELAGWDWTAIQLDDGTEVKAYRLRTNEGGADPWSAVYWIDSDGGVSNVYAENFTWDHDRKWTSDVTGNQYPNTITISAVHPDTGERLDYSLRPFFMGQEFVGNRGDNAYWEGACEVFDADGNKIGRAYLELAGYGGGLGDRLTK
ncbi:MAG: lipocalin-like domain-containing protein [Verrucomicrobiota bacterium]